MRCRTADLASREEVAASQRGMGRSGACRRTTAVASASTDVGSSCPPFVLLLRHVPPQLARVLVEWLSDPGDIVYDPFSGRGTVALESILAGRVAWAADANPLAVALSKAKVGLPSGRSINRRLDDLRRQYVAMRGQNDHFDTPSDIRMLYARNTLDQLCFLRERLGDSQTDAFITAMILGMLHGNHSKSGATRGFSISMPNTFAMSPGYVKSYIKEHNLLAPEVDVFSLLTQKVDRLALPTRSLKHGHAWEGDARRPPKKVAKAKLLLSSPPYLQVIKYAKYNWVRLWYLGHDWRDVDNRLMASGSLERYCTFLRTSLEASSGLLTKDAVVALVIGDVRRGDEQLNLAHEVTAKVAEPSGWRHLGTVTDEFPIERKVSRIWKSNSGRATKVDRVVLLTKHPSVELKQLPSINWANASSKYGVMT